MKERVVGISLLMVPIALLLAISCVGQHVGAQPTNPQPPGGIVTAQPWTFNYNLTQNYQSPVGGVNTATFGAGAQCGFQLTYGPSSSTIATAGSASSCAMALQLSGTNVFNITNPNGTWFQVTGPNAAATTWMECTAELVGAPPGCFATNTSAGTTGDVGANWLTTCHTNNTPAATLGSNEGANWLEAIGPCVSADWLVVTAGASGASGIVALTAGNGGNGVSIQLPVVAIGSLPSCVAGLEGTIYAVNNGVASPAYNATVSTTGSTHVLVYCNGTNWTYH